MLLSSQQTQQSESTATAAAKTASTYPVVDLNMHLEPGIGTKISEHRFKRNFYASSDLRAKHFSSYAGKEKKPHQDPEWFSLTTAQQKLVEYNYAGYMAPLKPTAKEVRESFFNSR